MAQVNVKFTSSTAGFQKGLNAVKAGIGGLVAVTSTVLAPVAALAAAVGGIGAAFKGVSLAADMESMEASFTTMLGSAEDAKKVLADINKLASATPYGLEDLVQAARSLLAVTGKEKLTSTLTMIGDVASVAQKPIAEIASMYAKIKGGDVVQAEDLNQLADNLGGGVLQEFVRVLGVDSVKAVRKLGSESKITGAHLQQVFENLTSKGGLAFGAMASQSKTFNGLISTLKDTWDGLLREFGKPVMEALKPALTDGISLLEAMQAKARAFGEATAKAITFLRNAFKGGELASLTGSALILAAQSFVNLLVKGFTAAGGVLYNAFEAAANLILGVFSNAAMWEAMRAQFQLVATEIRIAIESALPEHRNKEAILNNLALDKADREADVKTYGMMAGSANEKLFSRAGDALKQSGSVFREAFKFTPDFFDTTGRMDALRKRWNVLSQPTEQGPLYGPELPQKPAPKGAVAPPPMAPTKTNFEPIVSSLARIGGAAGMTNNPLVSLHQRTNSLLEKVVEYSKPRPASAAPTAKYA